MGCRKQGKEPLGLPRQRTGGRSGPEPDPCHPVHKEGAQRLPLWSMEKDERLGLMDAKPERSPRQVRVLILPIRAASSETGVPGVLGSASDCLRQSWGLQRPGSEWREAGGED